MDDQGKLISEIMSNELTADLNATEQPILHAARRAIEQGVERCHLIGFKRDGALLFDTVRFEHARPRQAIYQGSSP